MTEDQDQGNYFERLARQQATEDKTAKAVDDAATAADTNTPPADTPPADTPPQSSNPFTPPFTLTPGTAATDPNRPATLPFIKGGPGEHIQNALADWKSWLPMAGATALELGEVAGGPPGWALAGLGAGAGSLLKSGLENNALPTDPESLKTAGWDAVTQGIIPKGISNATGAVLSRIFNPERMYKAALKPTGLAEESEKAVRGALEGKIDLGNIAASRAANTARQKVFDDEIDRLINSTPGSLPAQQWTGNVENAFDALRAKWGRDPVEGAAFRDQLDNAEKAFLLDKGGVTQPIQRAVLNKATGQTGMITVEPENMTIQELRANAQPMSLPEAQGIKSQSYITTRANQKTVQSAWSSQYQSGVGVEARNAIASALREDLENYPGLERLKELNRQSGDSQALDKALEKFARKSVPSLLGSAAVWGGGAYFLSHGSPETAFYAVAGNVLKHAMEDPLIRSRLAIALYGAGPVTQAVTKGLGRAAIRGTVSGGKILLDPEKAKQGPPEQAKGGAAKSDSYLRDLERRTVNRRAVLNKLTS
jgi:hypothetical protein